MAGSVPGAGGASGLVVLQYLLADLSPHPVILERTDKPGGGHWWRIIKGGHYLRKEPFHGLYLFTAGGKHDHATHWATAEEAYTFWSKHQARIALTLEQWAVIAAIQKTEAQTDIDYWKGLYG